VTVLDDDEDTPVGGRPVGRDTSERIELAVAAGVRRATGPQSQISVRGGVSLGNWLTIISLILGVLVAGGSVARAMFFSASDGAALQSTVTAQDKTLIRIESKLDKALQKP
jgi:hypothetical protein